MDYEEVRIATELINISLRGTLICNISLSRYSAPELKKLKRTSTRTDVFSFGVILLEILTRRRPGKVPSTCTYIDLPAVVKAAIMEERLSDVLDGELLQPSICTPTENGLLQVNYVLALIVSLITTLKLNPLQPSV